MGKNSENRSHLSAPLSQGIFSVGVRKGFLRGFLLHEGSTEEFLAMPLPGQEQEMGFFEERA